MKVYKPIYAILLSLILFSMPYLINLPDITYTKFFSTREHLFFSIMLIIYTLLLFIMLTKIIVKNKNIESQEIYISKKLIIKISMFFTLIAIIMNLLIDLNAFAYFVRYRNIYIMQASLLDFHGINILSQFYIPSFFIYFYLTIKAQYNTHKCRLITILLFIALLFRAVLISERLALLEFIVPFFILLNYMGLIKLNIKRVIMLIFAVLLFLSLLQGVREKNTLQKGQIINSNYFIKGVELLVTYYSDTTNKLYFEIKYSTKVTNFSDSFFYTPLRLLYRLGYIELPTDTNRYRPLDDVNGRDIRMTNPGGYTLYYSDFGLFAIIIYSLHIFFLIYSYDKFINNNLFFIGFYPFIYLSIIELPRYNYLYLTRFTIPVIFYLYVYLIINLLAKKYYKMKLKSAKNQNID